MIEWYNAKKVTPKPFVSVLAYMLGEAPCPTVHEGYFTRDGIWIVYGFARESDEVAYWAEMPEFQEANNE